MIASAVILAAGRGDRMRSGANKILMPIGGQPLICWTVSAFTEITDIEDLVLVVHAGEIEAVKKMIQPIAPHIRIVEGGTTRRDSAIAGVRAALGDIVLIHDGARPFPTRALIHSVLAEAARAKAAIPVLPITDLLHHVDVTSNITERSETRNHSLARAQTPQGFHRDLILRCLEAAPPGIRDDASAVLLAGKTVATIPGERTNIKITLPEDLPLAEAIAALRKP